MIMMELITIQCFSTYNNYREIINCSPEWDGIKPDIIKQTYSSMIEPLFDIIHLSFDKVYLPDKLNIANVVPIFKINKMLH